MLARILLHKRNATFVKLSLIHIYIAHELRTPVTSIRGYLETVLVQSTLDEHKKQHFISKAYNQTIILSELIGDMSLITKIERCV